MATPRPGVRMLFVVTAVALAGGAVATVGGIGFLGLLAPHLARALFGARPAWLVPSWIAMCLAQQTPIMLLDEPTTFLDIAHQLEVLDLLHELNRTAGTTIVMVLHDLNHAAQYADYVIAVADGGVHSLGRPVDVFTTETLREVFEVEAVVMPHPVTGAPLCLPVPRASALVAQGASPGEDQLSATCHSTGGEFRRRSR